MSYKKKQRWKKELEKRREAGGFIALPHAVLRSDEFAALSPFAVKLLVDMLAQFNGRNNGDLAAYWSKMRARGWRSKETLFKALGELVNEGWVITTRQGGRNKTPSLYAVTFYAIDECDGKLDVQPTGSPSGEWRRVKRQERALSQQAGGAPVPNRAVVVKYRPEKKSLVREAYLTQENRSANRTADHPESGDRYASRTYSGDSPPPTGTPAVHLSSVATTGSQGELREEASREAPATTSTPPTRVEQATTSSGATAAPEPAALTSGPQSMALESGNLDALLAAVPEPYRRMAERTRQRRGDGAAVKLLKAMANSWGKEAANPVENPAAFGSVSGELAKNENLTGVYIPLTAPASSVEDQDVDADADESADEHPDHRHAASPPKAVCMALKVDRQPCLTRVKSGHSRCPIHSLPTLSKIDRDDHLYQRAISALGAVIGLPNLEGSQFYKSAAGVITRLRRYMDWDEIVGVIKSCPHRGVSQWDDAKRWLRDQVKAIGRAENAERILSELEARHGAPIETA